MGRLGGETRQVEARRGSWQERVGYLRGAVRRRSGLALAFRRLVRLREAAGGGRGARTLRRAHLHLLRPAAPHRREIAPLLARGYRFHADRACRSCSSFSPCAPAHSPTGVLVMAHKHQIWCL